MVNEKLVNNESSDLAFLKKYSWAIAELEKQYIAGDNLMMIVNSLKKRGTISLNDAYRLLEILEKLGQLKIKDKRTITAKLFRYKDEIKEMVNNRISNENILIYLKDQGIICSKRILSNFIKVQRKQDPSLIKRTSAHGNDFRLEVRKLSERIGMRAAARELVKKYPKVPVNTIFSIYRSNKTKK